MGHVWRWKNQESVTSKESRTNTKKKIRKGILFLYRNQGIISETGQCPGGECKESGPPERTAMLSPGMHSSCSKDSAIEMVIITHSHHESQI